MKIKDIGSTIEKIEDREIAIAYNCDVSFVLWAMVKKDDWKKFHKLVVKVPAKRSEMQEANKHQLVNVAIEKMKEVLRDAVTEPE